MFFGTVPTKCIEQVFRIIDFARWPETYVCCSGSFRIERTLRSHFPDMVIRSNDVSLYSSVIGAALTGQTLRIEFRDRLAFMESRLTGLGFGPRAAAVLVACDMARYARKDAYSKRHFAHYIEHFEEFLDRAKAKLDALVTTTRLDSYSAIDWRLHVDNAIAAGAGILAFPPFFRGDYEHQFKFVEDCVSWDNPSYELYDPKTLGLILDKIEASGVQFCILSDQTWPGVRNPVLEFVSGRKVPHYCYASTDKSSVRHLVNRAEPFRYTPVDPAKLTAKTKIVVTTATSPQLNFLKDVYLAKSIIHSPGMFNFLIWADGMLCGALIYSLQKFRAGGKNSIYTSSALYLLSDVTTTTAGRVSKLVALIATSQTILDVIGRRLHNKFDRVITTARSKNPVSMKYRGIYELYSRKPDEKAGDGHLELQYYSNARNKTPQELYLDWFRKHAGK